jgi:hypothetical protein
MGQSRMAWRAEEESGSMAVPADRTQLPCAVGCLADADYSMLEAARRAL